MADVESLTAFFQLSKYGVFLFFFIMCVSNDYELFEPGVNLTILLQKVFFQQHLRILFHLKENLHLGAA